MKYEAQINAAFNRLGFVPREGQREAVNQILEAFIDEKKENIVLCAPTGTGKSLIGAATAEALSSILGKQDSAIKSSISLCSTNLLLEQYATTFHGLGDKGLYAILKGASNYECSAFTTETEDQTADNCGWFTMLQNQREFGGVMAKHCDPCAYLGVKRKKNLVRHLTTNYSYFFIDRLYSGRFEERDLIIWDEAHLINDLFAEHNAVHFSQKRLQTMQKEITDVIKLPDTKLMKTLAQIAADSIIPDKINIENYDAYLRALHEIYKELQSESRGLAERALITGNTALYSKANRFAKKYEGLGCKIDDLFKLGYPHVLDNRPEEGEVTVKPIFVGKMMGALKCAPHNLFMSATVTPEFMSRTLDLDPETTKFIKLPPTFPKENKEIVFFDTLGLSYTTLKDEKVVNQLCKNVIKVVRHHIEQGQRGIIITPSFKLQSEIVAALNKDDSRHSYELFDQRQGEKLAVVTDAFKKHSKGSAVLISPSLWEGVDLPGDLSEFQIIVKAPFGSLGDKRVKWILNHAPEVYSAQTIMKIIQGAGRSVRSSTDRATTYILDKSAEKLFSSKQNVWVDEFNLRFTRFL